MGLVDVYCRLHWDLTFVNARALNSDKLECFQTNVKTADVDVDTIVLAFDCFVSNISFVNCSHCYVIPKRQMNEHLVV